MHGTILRPTVDVRWTEAEDSIVRNHWPDRKHIGALLPHRTLRAIGARGQTLKIAGRDYDRPLTAREERKIKELAACFSSIEVIAAIMGRKPRSIEVFMGRRGWLVKKKPPTVTGHELFDAVRQRAFDMNLNYLDLDRSLGYRCRIFAKPNCAGKVSIGMIAKAVLALGGRLVVEWEPLEGDD